MARYPLNLPAQLKEQAEEWAARQGVSLNQFIMWAVAEKVGALSQSLDDPAFPRITYRRGAAGQPVPTLRGTGIRVQTVAVAARQWEMTPAQIAAEYELSEAHRAEIDCAIKAEQAVAIEVELSTRHKASRGIGAHLQDALLARAVDLGRIPPVRDVIAERRGHAFVSTAAIGIN